MLFSSVAIANSASISIATINNQVYTGQALSLGDTLTFSTIVPKLIGREYPMIAVICTQNDTIVFTQLDQLNASFLLGGYSSPWLDTGGTATCQADLDAYSHKGGNETVRILSEVDFSVFG